MLLEELVLPLKTDHSAFKAGIAFAAASVAALVAGMGLAIKATFKWADELDSIQDIMGVTNKTAAALNFTLRKSGTSTEALTKGMTILSKGLIKADGSLDTTGKSLKAWGINVLDANGMLKDQTTLIGDISDKYASFSTQQEKVNFLTETFGRSGAELIDFFDTLAAEGGIDSVTAKIERLGLAIDPNRYEQFNRNLEELKLVGLALAVGFTEKVMPVIEKFLSLIADPAGIDIGKIITWADNAIGVYLKGLGDSVNNWVSSGGPEKLTDNIVGWIEGIGEGESFSSKALIGAQHLIDAVVKAVKEIDWGAMATAMDEKTAEIISAHDWTASGDAFGDAIERLFSGSFDASNMEIPSGVAAMGQAISDWILGAVGGSDFGGWDAYFAAWPSFDANAYVQEHIVTPFKDAFNSAMNWSWDANAWAMMHIVNPIKKALGIASPSTVFFGIASDIVNGLIDGLNSKVGLMYDKLTAIAKEFYNRGTGWAQQAAKGFSAGVNVITSAIQGIVDTINGILKGIQTSFSIGFTYSGPGSTGGIIKPPKPKPPSGGGNGQVMMASGGSFVVPSRYGYEGFGMGGIATASAGERVTVTPQGQQQQIDEARLARLIVQALMQAGFSG